MRRFEEPARTGVAFEAPAPRILAQAVRALDKRPFGNADLYGARRAPGLQHEAFAVLRPFGVEALDPTQHLIAHMGQDKLATFKLRPMFHERLIVDVIPTGLIEEVAVADEEVGPLGGLDQRVRPLRVTGVCDDLVFARDAERVGGGATGVYDLVGGHRERSDRGSDLAGEL